MRKFYSLLTAMTFSMFTVMSMAQTVNIDNADLVEIYNQSTYQQETITTGANTLSPSTYSIRCTDSNSCFNKVELNGTAVADSYGYYQVTLKENDVLDIVTKFDADNFNITLNAIEGIVTSVTANGKNVESTAQFEAPAGKKVIISLNKEMFDITSIKVNDAETSTNYNGQIEFYAKSTTTVDIIASKKATAKVTIDDASKIRLTNQSTYSDVTLTNGEQNVATGTYTISPMTYNYYLNKVELNGVEVADSYGRYTVTIAENDVLNITASYSAEKFPVTVTAPEGAVSSAYYYLVYDSKTVENPLNFEVNAGCKVAMYYNQDNYNVTSVKCNGKDITFSNGSFEFIVKEASNIVITAEQKAAGTINVDDASKVSVYSTNGSRVNLVNGSQSLSEGTYRISSADSYYCLNTVELNGTTASEMYGTYEVTVAKDDVVTVKANFDAETYKLAITDTTNAISSVMVAGQSVSDFSQEFDVKAGAKVEIVINSALYKLNGAKINGEDIQVNGSSISCYVKGNSSLVVNAAEYAKITATLTVTDASHISVYEGTQYSYSGDPIALSGNSSDIQVSEATGYIHIKKNDLCAISSVTANGQTINADWQGNYVIKVTEGMKIEVVSSEVKSSEAKVIVTGKSYASSYFSFSCPSNRSEATINEGENKVKFTSDNNVYSLVIVGNDIETVVVKQNDKEIKPVYEGQFNYSITLADGDVITIDINNTLTAIDTITASDSKKAIFTISGRKVNEDINSLPKGIYIINGKKVSVK